MEKIAFYLGPRFERLTQFACGDGDPEGHGEKGQQLLRAKEAIRAIGKATDEELASRTPNSTGASGSAGVDDAGDSGERMAKCPRSLLESREQKREAEAIELSRHQPATESLTVFACLGQEMVAFDHINVITATQFDVIGYWRTAGKARIDKDSVVIEGPKFPLLSMLARIFTSV